MRLIKLLLLCGLLVCALLLLRVSSAGAGEADPYAEAYALYQALEAASGEEAVLTLAGDYWQEGDRAVLEKDEGTRIIIDGRGRLIRGMILGRGHYTLRNCVIEAIPVDESRPQSFSTPGLELDLFRGDLRVTLEDSVTLVTGPDARSAPVEIGLAALSEGAPLIALQNDATVQGEGVAVAYSLPYGQEEGVPLQLSGGSDCLYAFTWESWREEPDIAYDAPPLLRLADGLSPSVGEVRVTIPELPPLLIRDEGPPPEDPMEYAYQKYVLPFYLVEKQM